MTFRGSSDARMYGELRVLPIFWIVETVRAVPHNRIDLPVVLLDLCNTLFGKG